MRSRLQNSSENWASLYLRHALLQDKSLHLGYTTHTSRGSETFRTSSGCRTSSTYEKKVKGLTVQHLFVCFFFLVKDIKDLILFKKITSKQESQHKERKGRCKSIFSDPRGCADMNLHLSDVTQYHNNELLQRKVSTALRRYIETVFNCRYKAYKEQDTSCVVLKVSWRYNYHQMNRQQCHTSYIDICRSCTAAFC